MEKKLIGFKKLKAKSTGKPMCIAVIVTKFTAQQEERGSFGCDAESVFMPDDQYDYLTPDDLGKEVLTDYDIVGKRAYLRKLTVIRGKEGKG